MIYTITEAISSEEIGFFRSFNDGETWESINSGIANLSFPGIPSMTLSKDGYLYFYHINSQLYRSSQPITGAVCSIAATANLADGGQIAGAGSYLVGETAALTATPNINYEFVNWTSESGEILSEEPTYSFEVTHNVNLTANFKTSTSIGELSAHSFSVYPNPVSDYLYIGIDNTALSLNSHSITLTLYDIAGRLALKSPIKDGKVDLSRLSAGIYNLSIEYNGKTLNKKIVKR